MRLIGSAGGIEHLCEKQLMGAACDLIKAMRECKYHCWPQESSPSKVNTLMKKYTGIQVACPDAFGHH